MKFVPLGYRFVTFALVIAVFAAASAFAQTASKRFDVELIVNRGEKSVETDADLIINETSFSIKPDKAEFSSQAKEFNYADIKAADYSFAKKPMLSGGGAIATALLVSVFVAVPLLFVKKKKHWLAVRTETDYAIIKLGGHNHRQIVAELQTHGVAVSELKEEGKK